MDFLVSSFAAALQLIGSFSPDVVDAVRTSLSVAAGATVFAALFGIPVGLAVGLTNSRLKGFVVTALNTLMAAPTVVVGLLVYGFLSRQGPLGALGLLFTPTAIVIGGTLLASPIVANYTLASVQGADPRILPTALTRGAGPVRAAATLVGEIRFGVFAAVIVGKDIHNAKVSARNVLCGTVTRVVHGPVNAEVTVDLPGGNVLTAIVTEGSANRLLLANGDHVCALVKASSVILGLDS